jgi:hypothetical protein
LDTAASIAVMPALIVRVTSRFHVMVPFRASSVSVRSSYWARDVSVCFVALMA